MSQHLPWNCWIDQKSLALSLQMPFSAFESFQKMWNSLQISQHLNLTFLQHHTVPRVNKSLASGRNIVNRSTDGWLSKNRNEIITGVVGRVKRDLKLLLAGYSYFAFFKPSKDIGNDLATASLRLYRLKRFQFLEEHRWHSSYEWQPCRSSRISSTSGMSATFNDKKRPRSNIWRCFITTKGPFSATTQSGFKQNLKQAWCASNMSISNYRGATRALVLKKVLIISV